MVSFIERIRIDGSGNGRRAKLLAMMCRLSETAPGMISMLQRQEAS